LYTTNQIPIRMKQGIYATIWLISFLLLNSCTRQHNHNILLVQADSLMEEYPDSALHILESIESQQLTVQADRAYYALLLTQARDKNYIVQTDDSLIRTAVQYYDSIGDIPMQAKAHYHWGGVLRDQNNYFHALHLYINAANYAKRSEKSKLLSLIYNNIGNIYYQENHYNKADSMYQLLQQQATLQKDTINLVEALSKRGSINIEKGKAYYQQAESLLLQASELTKHFPNNMLKANIASSLSALYSRMQKGKEAIKYAKENFTHLTDTTLYAKGYLLLGDAYYKAQLYDSAQFYFNKALHTQEYVTKANTYMRLADIAKKSNKLEESLELERFYSAYQDSAYNQNLYILSTSTFYSPTPPQYRADFPVKRWVLYISICILIIGSYLFIRQYKYKKVSSKKNSIRTMEIDIEKVKGQLQETAFYKKAQSILNHQNDTDAKSTEKPVLTNDDQKSLIKEINCLIPEYTSHLRKNFPLLTDKDIFFCCIHLSGFSIQELGVILSRTPNSIYKRRGSILEKKMQLDKNDNFIKAITAI